MLSILLPQRHLLIHPEAEAAGDSAVAAPEEAGAEEAEALSDSMPLKENPFEMGRSDGFPRGQREKFK